MKVPGIIGCLAFLAAVPAAAQPGPIESLIERSPFLPPGYDARPEPRQQAERPRAPTPTAASRMELVGVAAADGVVSVSLRRRGEQRGEWLKPGESLDDVRFIRFDAKSREAVVETAGRRETVPLKPPSVGQMPAQPQRRPQQPPRPPRTQPGGSGEDSDDKKPRIPVRRRVIVPSK